MRRFLSRVVNVLGWALLVIEILFGFPLILFLWAVSGFRDWAEKRWPNREWPAAVHFWFRLLAPAVFIVLLIALFGFAIVWVRRLRDEPPT